MGVDGIKTGFLAYEKYSLASSMQKKNRRVTAVASGFETKKDRSKQSAKLLTYAITNFDLIQIVSKDKEIAELDVWLGKKNKVKTYIKKNVYKTIPKARKRYLKVVINYDGPIEAPIIKDDVLGKLKILYKDEVVDEYDLLAYENIKKVNIFSRIVRSINYLIWGDV